MDGCVSNAHLFQNCAGTTQDCERVALPALFRLTSSVAVMMDFRARRNEEARAGLVDEGIAWVAQVDGGRHVGGFFLQMADTVRILSILLAGLGVW